MYSITLSFSLYIIHFSWAFWSLYLLCTHNHYVKWDSFQAVVLAWNPSLLGWQAPRQRLEAFCVHGQSRNRHTNTGQSQQGRIPHLREANRATQCRKGQKNQRRTSKWVCGGKSEKHFLVHFCPQQLARAGFFWTIFRQMKGSGFAGNLRFLNTLPWALGNFLSFWTNLPDFRQNLLYLVKNLHKILKILPEFWVFAKNFLSFEFFELEF